MDNGSPSDMTGLSGDALAELDRLLAAEGVAGGHEQTIPRRDPGKPAPASFAQELLWLLDRATPGLTAYNLPTVRRLRGPLDRGALEVALSRLVARHEALRTRFADGEGHPVQIIDQPTPLTVRQVDLSALPDGEREREAEREVTRCARTPFDLANAPSFRATLIALGKDDHVLLLETHHIVVDGWSMGLIFRQLASAYEDAVAGREPSIPDLPLQPGDIAAWERQQLAGPRLEQLLTFWKRQLGDAAKEPLALPTDFPRGTSPTYAGARQTVVVRSEELLAFRRLGQAHQATLYMTLLAGFAAVLHRYTGRTNVLIGSGSAGRSLPEMQEVVGYLNSTLVQRADFSGDPGFGQLLDRVRASVVDAFDHQDIPLEKLVLELREGQERLADAPLFQVVLTMQDTIGGSLSFAGISAEPFGISLGATKFDYTLAVFERPDELSLSLHYRSDLFLPETVRRLLGHLIQLLKGAVEDEKVPVSMLPMLTAEERATEASWNATEISEGRPASLTELFEAQAARVPGRTAVVESDGRQLSFGQVNARANQLAGYLRGRGIGPGSAVGLLIDRRAEAVVGLLGILKAGGAFVPLSVDAPTARLAEQVQECGASVVVTLEEHLGRVPPGGAVLVLDREAVRLVLDGFADTDTALKPSPDDLAYVLFTSGSTGTPKGVAVTHGNVVHYARAVSRVLADVAADASGDGFPALDGLRFGLASTLAADLGNTSLFTALLSGGTLHLLAREVTTDPARFTEYLRDHPVDLLKITPSHLAALTGGRSGPALAEVLPTRWLIVGGEVLRPEIAQGWLESGSCRLLNHYGPTETTVGVCTFEVTPDSLKQAASLGARSVPIGRPLVNTRVSIVDAADSLLPVGVPGELVIGGAGVARGYVSRPDLTAERFADVRGDRVYRTGDRARRLPDGTIEFLGRTDSQVKVRGHRVELGEIEQHTRRCPGVMDATVVFRESAGVEARLVAYVVLKRSGYDVAHGARVSCETVRDWLGAHLPEYMVPAAIVALDALPLTPNGKLDTRALPEPESDRAAQQIVGPRTDTEQALHGLWADALKRDPATFGVTHDFLALGGHSLVAIRILGKISRTFGLRLPLRVLFDAPKIEQLAEIVELERKLAALDSLAVRGPDGASPA